jgi:hypothetical protein
MVANRLYLIMVGVVCTVAGADAQSLSDQSNPARAHVKATVAGSASSSGSLGVKFSDPYAPPVGSGKAAIAGFAATITDDPVEPQGGISLTAGRAAPGEPMTGGLKLRF